MNLKTISSVVVVILVGAIGYLVWPTNASSSGPSQQQILETVTPMLPSYVEIKSLDYKYFPAEAGIGRVSVEGISVVSHDLYIENTEFWRSSIAERYARDKNVEDLSSRDRERIIDAFERERDNAKVRLFVVSDKAGTVEISFNYEFIYRETPGGFDLEYWDGRDSVRDIGQRLLYGDLSRRNGIIYETQEAEDFYTAIMERIAEMDRVDVEIAQRVERNRVEIRDLVKQDLVWTHSSSSRHTAWMIFKNCKIISDREKIINTFIRSTRGQYFVHSVRAECEGMVNTDSRDGRFRFRDGFELHPSLMREVVLEFNISKTHRADRSAGLLSTMPEVFLHICLRFTDDDVPARFAYSSGFKPGHLVCRGEMDRNIQWLSGREGFSENLRFSSARTDIVPIHVAAQYIDLQGKSFGQSNYSPVP